jgi:hypothetical protein
MEGILSCPKQSMLNIIVAARQDKKPWQLLTWEKLAFAGTTIVCFPPKSDIRAATQRWSPAP